jgi:hypothetical protein
LSVVAGDRLFEQASISYLGRIFTGFRDGKNIGFNRAVAKHFVFLRQASNRELLKYFVNLGREADEWDSAFGFVEINTTLVDPVFRDTLLRDLARIGYFPGKSILTDNVPGISKNTNIRMFVENAGIPTFMTASTDPTVSIELNDVLFVARVYRAGFDTCKVPVFMKTQWIRACSGIPDN